MVIAVAGVNFYYKDGSVETVGPRPVQLSSGQMATFASTKPLGCVQRIFLAITVVVPGEGSQNMTEMIDDCPPDQCMIRRARQLGPNKTVREAELTSENRQLVLSEG
ncbi:MAG: hypothetical protein WA047_01170 [Phenylobacterium sp.]|uniref:hypothetical protein n=1 Tax=Phenylobacterium sp. TaxID=1871053 RepID=UPI003BB6AF62